MTNIIQATKIAYSIKQKNIINNVSLKIKSDAITGLLGPNGAGKTTLFYILAGLIQNYNGSISLNQQNITKLTTSELIEQGVAFLPQNSSIFQGLSVTENILSGLDFQKKKISKNSKQIKLESVLKTMNIEHIKHTKGISLSGGERRRVELARCLIMQPKFILLDEPFAGIDPITIKSTKIILKEIAKSGTGILISDHNAPDTLDLCDQIYVLYKGSILTMGNSKDIANNPNVKKLYLGD